MNPQSALGKAYFLRALSPRELDRIAALAMPRQFAAGDEIVAAGAELHELHVIASGRVRVSVPVDMSSGSESAEEADEVIVHLSSGECFGEFAFADRKPASAAVVAEEETSTWALPFDELDRELEADAAVARKVLRSMLEMVVGRLRSTDAELVLARYILRYV